jgi:disulfide bond formation protein DsbB
VSPAHNLRGQSLPRLDLAGALLCALLVLGAYALQWLAGMTPCPLCLLERFLLAALGLAFAANAWARPRARGHWAAGGLLLLPTAAGVAASVHHLRIQSGAAPATCGEPAARPAFNQGLPFATEPPPEPGWTAWLPETGASCAQADLLLGLPLTAWALAAFAALGGTGLLAHFAVALPAFRFRGPGGPSRPS